MVQEDEKVSFGAGDVTIQFSDAQRAALRKQNALDHEKKPFSTLTGKGIGPDNKTTAGLPTNIIWQAGPGAAAPEPINVSEELANVDEHLFGAVPTELGACQSALVECRAALGGILADGRAGHHRVASHRRRRRQGAFRRLRNS